MNQPAGFLCVSRDYKGAERKSTYFTDTNPSEKWWSAVPDFMSDKRNRVIAGVF